jgi:hypothetical protein
MMLILLIAAFISARSFAAVPDWVDRRPLAVAIGTGVVLCTGSLLIYENLPLSMDEYAQLFQSEVFVHRRLTGQFPVTPPRSADGLPESVPSGLLSNRCRDVELLALVCAPADAIYLAGHFMGL